MFAPTNQNKRNLSEDGGSLISETVTLQMKSICSYEVLVSTYQTQSCQSEDKTVCNSENYLSIYYTTGYHHEEIFCSSENLAPNRQNTPCHVQDAGSVCSAFVPLSDRMSS
jgi:hypothetical protein